LILLFVLLFAGAKWFGVRDISTNPCFKYDLGTDADSIATTWGASNQFSCTSFTTLCPAGGDLGQGTTCLEANGMLEFPDIITNCLSCAEVDYTHGSIIFNAFIWCQIFNEYTARSIKDGVNPFAGIFSNLMFFYVSIFSAASQVLIIEYGGRFTSTSPLTLEDHFITMGLGAFSILVGMAMRFYPCEEDPATFFGSDDVEYEPNSIVIFMDWLDSFWEEEEDDDVHPDAAEEKHLEGGAVATTDPDSSSKAVEIEKNQV